MAARLTPEQRALRAILEKDWQRDVEGILKANGWLFYHAADNSPRTSASGRKYVQNIRAGFPDLIAVRGPRLAAVELKRELGVTTPEQDDWLSKLRVAGVEVYVWRPSDRLEVVRVLSSVSPEPRVVLDM